MFARFSPVVVGRLSRSKMFRGSYQYVIPVQPNLLTCSLPFVSRPSQLQGSKRVVQGDKGHLSSLMNSGGGALREPSRGNFRELDDPRCQLVDLAELFFGLANDRSPSASSFWNVDRIERFGQVLNTLNYHGVVQGESIPKHVNGKHVSMLLYGLRGIVFRSNPTALAKVVGHINTYVLSPLVQNKVSFGQPLSTRQVVMMLSSFQHVKLDSNAAAELRQFVRLLLECASRGHTAGGTDRISAQHICNIMCNLQNFCSDVEEVKLALRFLAKFIGANVGGGPSAIVLSPQHVGNALYGLRGMTSDCPEVLTLLDTLVTKNVLDYDLVAGQSAAMSVKELSNALYGLQGLSFDDSPDLAVTRFVNRCIPYFRTCVAAGEVSSQAIGNSVYGLRLLLQESSSEKSTSPVGTTQHASRETMDNLYDILATLFGNALSASPLVLSAQNASSALYGLSNSQCVDPVDNAALRKLLAVLASAIATVPAAPRSDFHFSPFQISNALYGLRHMSSAVPEVQALVGALLVRFKSSSAARREPLDSKHLSVALYGMRHMAAQHAGVGAMLEHLLSLYSIKADRVGVDFQSISNSLIGLQNHPCDVAVARELIRLVVIPQLQKLAYSTSLARVSPARASQTLANVLYGLRNKEDRDPLVVELLALVSRNLIPALVEASGRDCDSGGLFQSCRAIGSCLYGLQRCTTDHPEGRELVATLARHVDAFVQVASPSSIKPQHVAMMMYGCRYIHSTHSESQELYRSIVPLLSLPFEKGGEGTSVLNLYQLCRCLYGVQSLTYVPLNKDANGTTASILDLLLGWFQQLNAFSVDDSAEGWGDSEEESALTSAVALDYMDEEVEEFEFRLEGRARRGPGDVGTHNPVEDIQKAMGVGLAMLRESLDDGCDNDSTAPSEVRVSSSGSVTVSVAGNRNMPLAHDRKGRQRLSELIRMLQKELVLYIAYRE